MKFISSSYNEKTGVATVIVQHMGRKFTGKAKVHPEEKYPSEFAGCSYAEIRAEIKALKYERKLAKNKADMAIDFIRSCQCYKNFDRESETAKTLYRQISKRVSRVNNITDEINLRLKELEFSIKKREVTLKTLANRKRTKENKENKTKNI